MWPIIRLKILVCLALALVAGGAIGWLTNGFRAAKREHKIREELIRQSLALNQAETDNKMIEDDYRELKYRSEESIALLKEETKQVPVLQENLEKSQTLVRQMLQKHEAEQRRIQAENNQLGVRLKELENRERAVAKLQMDLNTERLNRKRENDNLEVTADVLPETTTALPEIEATADTQPPTRQTEMALDELASQVEAAVNQSPQSLAETISELEEVHENAAHEAPLGDSTETLADAKEIAQAQPADPDLQIPVSSDTSVTRGDLSLEAQAEADNAEESDATESEYDFGQTERDDNLQEIFGIGPVAERALRKLGITSYEQIAALEREHIEYIADQLEIFPARIERDDWVGSAKRRLEQENATEAETSDVPELEDA